MLEEVHKKSRYDLLHPIYFIFRRAIFLFLVVYWEQETRKSYTVMSLTILSLIALMYMLRVKPIAD